MLVHSPSHTFTHTHTHIQTKQEQIVLRAIRDANVPKFLQEDLKLFISDLPHNRGRGRKPWGRGEGAGGCGR